MINFYLVTHTGLQLFSITRFLFWKAGVHVQNKLLQGLNSVCKLDRGSSETTPIVHAATVTSSLEEGLLRETSGLMNLTFPLPQYCSPSNGFCPSTRAEGSSSSMYPVLVPSYIAVPWAIRAVMSWSSPANTFLHNGNRRHNTSMYMAPYWTPSYLLHHNANSFTIT